MRIYLPTKQYREFVIENLDEDENMLYRYVTDNEIESANYSDSYDFGGILYSYIDKNDHKEHNIHVSPEYYSIFYDNFLKHTLAGPTGKNGPVGNTWTKTNFLLIRKMNIYIYIPKKEYRNYIISNLDNDLGDIITDDELTCSWIEWSRYKNDSTVYFNLNEDRLIVHDNFYEDFKKYDFIEKLIEKSKF